MMTVKVLLGYVIGIYSGVLQSEVKHADRHRIFDGSEPFSKLPDMFVTLWHKGKGR